MRDGNLSELDPIRSHGPRGQAEATDRHGLAAARPQRERP